MVEKLTEEQLNKVRQLRKTDRLKAAKLYKRLVAKRKIPASNVEAAVAPPHEIEDDDNATNEDSDENYYPTLDASVQELVDVANDNVSPEALEEIKELCSKFYKMAETRGAGKGSEDQIQEEEDVGSDGYDDFDEDQEIPKPNPSGLSRKKVKEKLRPTIFYLKQICSRPEVVESWDTTAPDPKLLITLKATRNTIGVPAHWSHKRRYLQGKRGSEKTPFVLPHYIEATRISEIRSAIEQQDNKKTLKQRLREKSRPRHRKMDIDYQTLHDAFFKFSSKPKFTKFGDVYFEGKETEMHFRRYTPGKLTDTCREALGMSSLLDSPPWLLNMQRYGPPPSYPNLIVPGVNAHIPDGASLGFQAGGWGKPPSIEQLKLWGITPRFEEIVLGEGDMEEIDHGEEGCWGALQMKYHNDPFRQDDDDADDMQMEDEDEDVSNALAIHPGATLCA